MLLNSVILITFIAQLTNATIDSKRLYDDLMSGYNKLIRPVNNNSDILKVRLGLKLTQLIDVNLKSQIMSTNVWLTQEWYDYKLKWDPTEYGGVSQMYVPSEQIWLPDIVLYNNADGNYEIVTMTKAIIYHDGRVAWNPPAIYKSSCNIDITYFPFDYQECTMKFGTWTYDGNQVDLRHLLPVVNSSMNGTEEDYMEIGIDLSEFYLNVEWDIMKVPARRKEIKYSCCPEVYLDITYNLMLRRKTLFYMINLIIPCVSISALSILVFYLPSDSGEKVTLSVSILLSLIFFFLVLIEIIPSTSLVIPLLGKYLIFTMILVTVSVIVTIIVLNIHFRSPSTHRMSPWIRKTFIHTLPKLLLMRPPQYKLELERKEPNKAQRSHHSSGGGTSEEATNPLGHSLDSDTQLCYPRKIDQVIRNAIFIAHHIDNADEYKSNQDDWKYVSMVLDRLFLWIFTLACIVGTGSIFTQAPSIYDSNIPLDVQKSTLIRSQL